MGNKVKYGFEYPVIQQHRDTHKAWFEGKDGKANVTGLSVQKLQYKQEQYFTLSDRRIKQPPQLVN